MPRPEQPPVLFEHADGDMDTMRVHPIGSAQDNLMAVVGGGMTEKASVTLDLDAARRFHAALGRWIATQTGAGA